MTTDDEEYATNASAMDRVARIMEHATHMRRHGEDGGADSAMARAEAIMLKYNFTVASLAARGMTGSEGTIESEHVEFTGIYRASLVVEFNRLVAAFTTVS